MRKINLPYVHTPYSISKPIPHDHARHSTTISRYPDHHLCKWLILLQRLIKIYYVNSIGVGAWAWRAWVLWCSGSLAPGRGLFIRSASRAAGLVGRACYIKECVGVGKSEAKRVRNPFLRGTRRRVGSLDRFSYIYGFLAPSMYTPPSIQPSRPIPTLWEKLTKSLILLQFAKVGF
jgi:hypothetical protein